MRIRLAVPDAAVHPDVMDAALEAVTRTNEHLIHKGHSPDFQQALKAGVKWKPEPPGDEHFDHGGEVAKRGWGDCDDLAPLHAATLRVRGVDPEARAVVVRSGPKSWHAVVERGDGTIDDPSEDAGMYEYHLPIQPRLNGPESRINIAARLAPGNVWAARCDVPWRSSRVALSGHGLGHTREQAILSAIQGPIIIGEASGCIEPEHSGKLAVIHGVLCGADGQVVVGVAEQRLTRGQFEEALLAARGMSGLGC